MTNKIKIGVLERPDAPGRCSAADVIRPLLRAGRLPLLVQAASDLRLAPYVAVCLMRDLTAAGQSAGWTWVRGQIRTAKAGVFENSWLEFDGWAVDTSGGECLCMDAEFYRRAFKAKNVRVGDAAAVDQWWEDQAEREEIA